jgi:hypothetical protein
MITCRPDGSTSCWAEIQPACPPVLSDRRAPAGDRRSSLGHSRWAVQTRSPALVGTDAWAAREAGQPLVPSAALMERIWSRHSIN